MRRLAYRQGWLRSERLPVPVIVVGNIAVGGSGKTPVVHWLVERLRAQGHRPGIVSRGYGGQLREPSLLPAHADPAVYGDEPVLLAQLTGCPVAIGADRPAAARLLLEGSEPCSVIISDDGLQHYRLARDIELIVVDEAVLGNRFHLPAGPLREGLGRLAQADLVLFNGPASAALRAAVGKVPAYVFKLRGDCVQSLTDPGCRRPLAEFAGRRVHALAGIGRPERFFAQLEAAGLQVIRHPRPDHHRFGPADFIGTEDAPRMLTAKDAVKCAAFAPPDTWVLPVRVDLADAALGPILEKLEHGRPSA